MTVITALSPTSPRLPRMLAPGIALAALAWNLFGALKFFGTLESTPASLEAMGMTPAQAATYSAYPTWMTAAFAVGVFGGLLGSGCLLLRWRAAVPIFAASLGGYVLLFIGDIVEGVFAALGLSQVLILSFVVAIAAALLAWSRRLAVLPSA